MNFIFGIRLHRRVDKYQKFERKPKKDAKIPKKKSVQTSNVATLLANVINKEQRNKGVQVTKK